MAPELVSARTAARQVFSLLNNEPKISVEQELQVNRRHFAKVMNMGEQIVPLSSKRAHEKWQAKTQDNQSGFIDGKSHESRPAGAEIVLQDVRFVYPSRPDTEVLQNVSLQIAAGQFVAFVGPSGAGKSSLVAILERFFDATSGKVLIDGRDIQTIPIDEHRSQIGLVSQEPELFAGSISFNISLGAQQPYDVRQEEIEQVCISCGIHEFISSLPDGYETECGNQGSKLSGGQKQRIAVARALIRNPRILLLDEATASLDSHSEKDIERAVDAAIAGRTTIVVAHRLSTIQNADYIFVFDNGTLVDSGTHSELLQRGGIYSGMVQMQALD